jgi:hypothetical protein
MSNAALAEELTEIHTDILRKIFSHLCDEAFRLYCTWLKLEIADSKSTATSAAWEAFRTHCKSCTDCKETPFD